jgi:hypothetical protein
MAVRTASERETGGHHSRRVLRKTFIDFESRSLSAAPEDRLLRLARNAKASPTAAERVWPGEPMARLSAFHSSCIQ